MEDVEAATRDDVEAFFRRYYVPSNASLCLVGDIDEDRALALAERYFGPTPRRRRRRPGPGRRPIARPATSRSRSTTASSSTASTWPGRPSPSSTHDDAAARCSWPTSWPGASRAGSTASSSSSDELAQDVSAYQSGRELAGTLRRRPSTLRPGQSRAEARDLIDAEIAAIAASGVRPSELARVKNGRLAGFFYALDNIGGFGGVADRLNAYNTYLGDPGRITTDFERYQAVTPEAVARGAPGGTWSGSPRVALTVVGRKAAATVAPPLDRSVPPASPPAARVPAPRPEVRHARLRAAALGHPAPRPADRRGDARPRRRGGEPRARPGRAWPADRR